MLGDLSRMFLEVKRTEIYDICFLFLISYVGCDVQGCLKKTWENIFFLLVGKPLSSNKELYFPFVPIAMRSDTVWIEATKGDELYSVFDFLGSLHF